MLDKYFGFLKIQDERSVMESLINHSKIDEEKILLLNTMIASICTDKADKGIKKQYMSIRKINENSIQILESISDQIIQAHFDHQKQYDLLRVHQRIESISGLSMATAKRVLIFERIYAEMPEVLYSGLNDLSRALIEITSAFNKTLTTYIENKKEVIKAIHQVEEKEHFIDHIRSNCLEILYRLGNQNSIPIGSFMIIQEIIEHLEEVSDAIESAAHSLDWLLLA